MFDTDDEGSDPAEAVQDAAGNVGRHLLFDKAVGAASPKALHLFEGDGGSDTTPTELLSKDEIKKGGFLLYLFGCLYVFLGLAIVCDEYFVPALDVLVEVSGVSDDVAGATFMAAGGSAPELFTSLIGTFMESSVGFGTIVGSAVFNILFVIGMCALKSPDVIQLTWWPLFRDMSYYLLAIGVLAIVFGVNSKSEIEWWEALLLFLLYIGYCTLMKFNLVMQGMVERAVGFTSGMVEAMEDLENGDIKDDGPRNTIDVISIIRGTKMYGSKKVCTSIYHVGILNAITRGGGSEHTIWFKPKGYKKGPKNRKHSILFQKTPAELMSKSTGNSSATTNLKIVDRMRNRIADAVMKVLGVQDISKSELDAPSIVEILKELVKLNMSEFTVSEDDARSIIKRESGKDQEKLSIGDFEDWLPDSSYGRELLCECTFQVLDENNNGFILGKDFAKFVDSKTASKLNGNAGASNKDWEGMKVEVARAWWKNEKKKEVKRLTILRLGNSQRGGQNGLIDPNAVPINSIKEDDTSELDDSEIKPSDKVEKIIVKWFKDMSAGVDYMKFNQWYFSEMYEHHKLALSPRGAETVKREFWGDDSPSSSKQLEMKKGEKYKENGDVAESGSKDEETEDELGHLRWPSGGSAKEKFVFILIAPHMFMMFFTIPDCKKEKYKSWYKSAFVMSIVWIGIYSYLMVWWTTTIGDALGIPDEVMGLTFLAAGTSIPDLMTSVIVAMEGKGDMALLSSIGSNIFDILVGLPVPWLLYAAAKQKSVNVAADTLFGSLLVLFIMIFLVLVQIKYFKFKLEKGLGYGMLALYLVFLLQDIFRNPTISPFY